MSGFRLSKKPLQVWWPVRIHMPVNNGETQEFKIELLFEVAGVKALEEVAKISGPESWARSDADDQKALEFLMSKIKGWKNVKGETGESEVKFSEAKLAQLLDATYIVGTVQEAYFECIKGRKAKN